MYLLGFDIGTSAVKACLLDAGTGRAVASASSPQTELEVSSPRPGWAEQDPETWWDHACRATAALRETAHFDPRDVAALGIAYQMHGLVLVGGDFKPLRPAILWCDGRAVGHGDRAAAGLGRHHWFSRLLNHPGNFTASRILWVRDHEPQLYSRARHALLPGDYVALRMTGLPATSESGLSEMILWDFLKNRRASEAEEQLGLPAGLVPEAAPSFGARGGLTREAASSLGLAPGTPVTYRAGDQPNNAFSLGVIEPGQVAATAGTSGVVFGVSDRPVHDDHSRVNVFLHVTHAPERRRLGVLMCVNGAGSLYRWMRNGLLRGALDYAEMDALASTAPPGSEELVFLPYGNGPERTLENVESSASLSGLDFNRHGLAHVLRAGLEGVVFALDHGLGLFRHMGMRPVSIRAGRANLFRSRLFTELFAAAAGTPVELFDTDGAQGAARGAGVGAGLFSAAEACRGLEKHSEVAPEPALSRELKRAKDRWNAALGKAGLA